MKSQVVVLVAALAAFASSLIGCAEDDYDREAAYPQPIGYTQPATSPPSAAPATSAAAQSSPGAWSPAPSPPPTPAAPLEGQWVEEPVGVGEEQDGAGPESSASQAPAGQDYADADPSALSDFRPALDPYGTWVDDPTYGTIWVPSPSVVGSDFTPYQTAGHWVYDDDYTWVSDYDWGWAPFHYGRWAYAAPYGWGWIPGRVYSGAWVTWRYGYGDWAYVGWAPLGPRWGWRGGLAFGLGFAPAEPFGFCAVGDLFAPHVGGRMVGPGQAGMIGAHTRPYVPAAPGVAGRIPATPRVGPSPQVLGIPSTAVARGALANRGVVQARAFAHANTAAALGAHVPQEIVSRRAGVAAAYAPGSRTAVQPESHFGGRLGYGIRGSVNNVRPVYGGTAAYTYHGGFGSYSSPVMHSPALVHPSSGNASSGHSGGTGYTQGGYLGGHHVGSFTGWRGTGFGGGIHAGSGGSPAGGRGFGGGGGCGGGHGGGGRR